MTKLGVVLGGCAIMGSVDYIECFENVRAEVLGPEVEDIASLHFAM